MQSDVPMLIAYDVTYSSLAQGCELHVGTLLRYPPMTAPRMVDGSMTSMRSQSIRGLGLKEWRRLMLKKRLATAPPTMVKLERATAYFAEKPAKN